MTNTKRPHGTTTHVLTGQEFKQHNALIRKQALVDVLDRFSTTEKLEEFLEWLKLKIEESDEEAK